jgi:hypothetical protein
VEVVQSETDLLQIIGALKTPRRFSNSLNSRQEKAEQQSNYPDYHEQLEKAKS